MASSDILLYEYSVIRCVPRVDREEFVNVGLIMMCKRRKWLRAEIEINPYKLEALDPYINLTKIENQASFFKRQDVPAEDLPVEEKYRWLSAVKSAMIQTSPSHPGLVKQTEKESSPEKILEKEFSRLFKELVL